MSHHNFLMITSLCLLTACATVQTIDEEACALADSDITFTNLLKNSLTSAYERCLSATRDKAASELES